MVFCCTVVWLLSTGTETVFSFLRPKSPQEWPSMYPWLCVYDITYWVGLGWVGRRIMDPWSHPKNLSKLSQSLAARRRHCFTSARYRRPRRSDRRRPMPLISTAFQRCAVILQIGVIRACSAYVTLRYAERMGRAIVITSCHLPPQPGLCD